MPRRYNKRLNSYNKRLLGLSLLHCKVMYKPGTVFLLLVFVLTLLLPCEGHIHSQKIRDYGGVSVSLETWVLALVSACLVGLCGVVPLFLNRWIRLDKVSEDSNATMQTVLSFAVGGLLGDVWLHLLPESWGSDKSLESVRTAGLWVITGLLTFMLIEKIGNSLEADPPHHEPSSNTTIVSCNGNGHAPPAQVNTSMNHAKPHVQQESFFGKSISGYLNLVANVTDNFTHGLAIAASYIVNPLVGILTTAAIICHEIPHEIGDFAILLKSGFSVPTAIKAQLVTACGGILGVTVGLCAEQMGHCTTWMLPFTAGGFLYIAMVTIIPDLIQEDKYSWRQLLSVLVGIAVMAAVTIIERKSCAAMPGRS